MFICIYEFVILTNKSIKTIFNTGNQGNGCGHDRRGRGTCDSYVLNSSRPGCDYWDFGTFVSLSVYIRSGPLNSPPP